MLTVSDRCADNEVALIFFRLTKIAIAVIEMMVIKKMATVSTPIETPNTRPLTVNELVNEAPVTVYQHIIKCSLNGPRP